MLYNLSELSDRAVNAQRVGRDHGDVVGRVPELPQRRAGLVVHVTTVTGTHHRHAASGLGLRALPDNPGAGRRGEQHRRRRRRQAVRGRTDAAGATGPRGTGSGAAASVPVDARDPAAAHPARTADRRQYGTGTAVPAVHALPGHRPRDAVALAPLTLAPVDGQVPAVQLDVRHRPGRRAPVVARRPAVVAAAQRRRGVPQVPVVVRDQRRGAVLSGQHGFAAGRRTSSAAGTASGTSGGTTAAATAFTVATAGAGRVRRGAGDGRPRRNGRGRRGPGDRQWAHHQQRSGFLAATVTAVRHRFGHVSRCVLYPPDERRSPEIIVEKKKNVSTPSVVGQASADQSNVWSTRCG